MIRTLLTKVNSKKIHKIIPILLLEELDGTGLCLCGGSLLTLFDQEINVSDFDIFIKSTDRSDLEKKKKQIEDFLQSKGAKEVFRCPKGFLTTYKYYGAKFQIINVDNNIYSSVEDIIDRFDFDLCRIGLDMDTGELVFDKKCLRNLKKKELSVHRITYPAASINRLVKFRNKGYKIHKAAQEITEKIASNLLGGIPMNNEIVYVD